VLELNFQNFYFGSRVIKGKVGRQNVKYCDLVLYYYYFKGHKESDISRSMNS